jgi:archaellum biogenesis ATPase FlaH
MPIIKPLQLEPTSDIEDFAATIFQPKTLSIIYGPKGVGKTALLYKLMYQRIKKNHELKGLFHGMNKPEIYKFYQTKLLGELGREYIRVRYLSMGFTQVIDSKKVYPYISAVQRLMKKYDNYFFIVDGLRKLPTKTFFNVMTEFRNVADSGIPVLVTMDTKPDLSNLIETSSVTIQTFQLERPEFLGGEILEFGDTRLIKDE